MNVTFLKSAVITSIIINLISFGERAYCAVDQLLNGNFYQNPAELSLIDEIQLMGGNLFITPTFKFTGTSAGGTGSATSNVTNYLPYLLTAYRVTDRFVVGFNITPSGYGHLDWPMDSIVVNDSTVTNLLYYRAAIQSSYQLTDKLALGVGLNLEENYLAELDFVIPNQGNQINKARGLNYTADIGLLYKFNPRNTLTMAVYSPVDNKLGYGSSVLNTTVSNNFSLNLAEAAVAFVGLQHQLTDKWFLEEKVYWSGWSILKNIYFTNTTTGTYVTPTNWKDVWSYQGSTRYAITEKIALLGSAIYETNPTTVATNQLGYPLSDSASGSIGLDLSLQKKLSTQIVYSYGTFISKSPINTSGSKGSVTANSHAVILQLTYKT